MGMGDAPSTRMKVIGLFAVLAMAAVGCGDGEGSGGGNGGDDAASAAVRFQASWIPDCQFAGYLMARERGIYSDHDLNVEILPGGPNVNPVQQVVSGAADVTVNKVIALYAARAEGLPVTAIAQFDRVSSFPLVAFTDAGVETPEDLAGKEVGIWYDGDEYEVLALLDEAGLDPDTDVTLFEQGFTMDPFLNREYDVAMVTSFNELNVLRLAGVDPDTELSIIDPSEYGISIPHGTVIANEEWVGGNPDVAARFVGATIEGWRYAFDNKEETAGVCAENALAAGGEAATENLAELQTLILDDMERLHFEGIPAEEHGQIDPELYENVANIAFEYGLLETEADVEAGYDASIWESAVAD
ncbi:MAG: ABC transporter substrate-binding protein [Acidimicrobiales bacterium]